MSVSKASSNSPSSQNEKIIFNDEQHAKNISGKLLKFYKEENFFDIDLITDNDRTKIQAHKIVLSASSEYFLNLFRRNSKISTSIVINRIESSSLKLIIDYMYSDSIEFSIEKMESILRGAVLLQMKNLIDGCCGFLENNLNTGNCLRWLNLSKELGLTAVRDKFLKFIYKNFVKATKETEFFLLDVSDFKDLLFNNNTYTNLEEQVFLSLVAWIEYDKINRQHLLKELLSMVRYHFLTAKFIIENIKSVSTTIDNCHLIHGWLRYHLSPESRTDEEQTLTSFTSESKTEVNLVQGVDTVAETSTKVDKLGAVCLNSRMEIDIRSFNQEMETWSMEKRSRAAPLLKNISHHSLILIDEKLYVVGGINNNVLTKSVTCIDLKTFKWTDLPPMRVARCKSQLANLNGHLCVFGGFGDPKHPNFIDSVEIFNTSTQKWNDLQPLEKPSLNHKITGHNGILYIFDFRYGCMQCYNVSSDKWTLKELTIDDDVEEICFTAINNCLYAIFIGGNYYEDNPCPYYDSYDTYKKTSLKRFDLIQNSWSELAKLPRNSQKFEMATVIGHTIFFCKDSYLVDYNLDTKEFTYNNGNICYPYDPYIFLLQL